jgi:hypothetical protein
MVLESVVLKLTIQTETNMMLPTDDKQHQTDDTQVSPFLVNQSNVMQLSLKRVNVPGLPKVIMAAESSNYLHSQSQQ